MTDEPQHTFLQRLPNIPQLRSLHLPNIADHAIPDADPKELALQIGDIITLRPDIQLCYIGIGSKCFEIFETTHGGGYGHGVEVIVDGPPPPPPGGPPNGPFIVEVAVGNGSVTSSSDDSDDDGDDASESEIGDTPGWQTDPDATQSEDEDGGGSDDDSSVEESGRGSRGPRLKLREILFYDDKVAIFKARHGRL